MEPILSGDLKNIYNSVDLATSRAATTGSVFQNFNIFYELGHRPLDKKAFSPHLAQESVPFIFAHKTLFRAAGQEDVR